MIVTRTTATRQPAEVGCLMEAVGTGGEGVCSMDGVREGQLSAFLEDVANMLSKQPGLTVGQAIAGLRGNPFRCNVRPTSGRRWRIPGSRGGMLSRRFEECLEANGYEVHMDGRAHRIVKVA